MSCVDRGEEESARGNGRDDGRRGDGDGAGVAKDATWPAAGRQGAIGAYDARRKGERSLGGGASLHAVFQTPLWSHLFFLLTGGLSGVRPSATTGALSLPRDSIVPICSQPCLVLRRSLNHARLHEHFPFAHAAIQTGKMLTFLAVVCCSLSQDRR